MATSRSKTTDRRLSIGDINDDRTLYDFNLDIYLAEQEWMREEADRLCREYVKTPLRNTLAEWGKLSNDNDKVFYLFINSLSSEIDDHLSEIYAHWSQEKIPNTLEFVPTSDTPGADPDLDQCTIKVNAHGKEDLLSRLDTYGHQWVKDATIAEYDIPEGIYIRDRLDDAKTEEKSIVINGLGILNKIRFDTFMKDVNSIKELHVSWGVLQDFLYDLENKFKADLRRELERLESLE